MSFDYVDFGLTPLTQFTARVSSGAAAGVSGQVQVVLDYLTATPVGSITVSNTKGWESWTNKTTTISGVTGIRKVFLKFTSDQPQDFVNVNWFTFAPPDVDPNGNYKSIVYYTNWVS
jgi:hypothetical protein